MKHTILTLTITSLLATTAFAGPIHDAAGAGRKKAVEQHIANGADVNAKDGDRLTPLHFAASGGHKEIVELLIAKGADVNLKNEAGWTPLHEAAWSSKRCVSKSEFCLLYLGTTEVLIKAEADLNAKTVSGDEKDKTALDLAVSRKNNEEIAKLLRKHGGKTGEELGPRLKHGKNQWPFDFSFTAKRGKTYVIEVTQDFKQWDELETIKGKGK